ncbi:beta 1-4 rhamnosyltransferase Cps2T [Peribacillus sp. NPDC097295]|uniref:beta 1-4 rhamnosyltransferase Cps2T n=1 Tax=Peribacillus sp. NPDC097295 TaxID=3364402 RepID=UPI00382D841E
MKNIFVIGSKGIPSNYGGFETFVDKLTEYKTTNEIIYHVSCLSKENDEEYQYNNARCFNVKVPNVGPATAVIYDIYSLRRVYEYIKKNRVENAIVYILACRIGPFMKFYKKKFERLNVSIYVNPDGHEWKRAKWNWLIRKYWKLSERLTIKNTDLVICDSMAIENYIKSEYRSYQPKTTFIAYGATINKPEKYTEKKYNEWLRHWNLERNDYYLIVGRFVAENNYEIVIREFMRTKSQKSLIIVTNVEGNKFYKELKKRTKFDTDNRVKFVGTIYEQDLLYQVRKGAYGYFHGHEVGGTNPSLLEAMATTSLNILLDVNFNREVGKDAVHYFNKEDGNLAGIIEFVDLLAETEIKQKQEKAILRIQEAYSWELIVNQYEKCFLK